MVSTDEMEQARGKLVKVTLVNGKVLEGKCTNYYWPADDEEEDMLEMGNTLLNQSEIAKIEYIKHNIKVDLDIEKIYEIYFKSKREKYIKVLLKENNETIYCKFDEVETFWIDDENDVNTGTLTVILRVILKDGTSRRLLNGEIQEVFW